MRSGVRRSHFGLALAVTAAVLSCRVMPQPPAPLSDVSFAETVSAGQVVGLVLDRETFRPIQWAMVSLTPHDAPPGSRAGSAAITDTGGTFHLPAPGQGRYSVWVRYICYRPRQMDVSLDSLSGLAVLILLTPHRILHCATDRP